MLVDSKILNRRGSPVEGKGQLLPIEIRGTTPVQTLSLGFTHEDPRIRARRAAIIWDASGEMFSVSDSYK